MRPLALDDLPELPAYEACRAAYRRRIIAHKRDRRVGVGDRVTLLFEDRETLRYQVLEMARVERITGPAKLQQELDVYNELLPGERELSATLFIEIPDLGSIRSELDRLIGLDECVSLVLGEADDEEELRARFDTRQLDEERISAVHYLRFRLDEAQAVRFADARVRARLRIDHPRYEHEAEISPPARASLLRDLRDETPVLLDPADASRAAPARDELLLETGVVRAFRPGRAAAPEHVVIEPVAEVASLLHADPPLLAELMSVAQRFAREMRARGHRARVAIDVDDAGAPGLRVHVLALEDRG